MRLKKLELSGFKSFAQKTVLEFPAKICAVVGPNGSGKSNIVDALRWVLGEQSFKQLRSKAGTDLIWAGSSKKPSMGKAGVSLYFDNSDNFFPLDFSEVIIGRKVYKDGQSEYYLNESQVRLKDVSELIARSRLGLRGHTIINQGSADSILKANFEERRGILEEALGLREFQLKKSETEIKLAETQANLERANGLVSEISPHLKLLKRQADKFARREEISLALKGLEDGYFKFILKDIIIARAKILQTKNVLAQEVDKRRKIFEEKTETLQAKVSVVPAYHETYEKIENDLAGLTRERQKILHEIGRFEGLIEAAKIIDPRKTKTIEAVLGVKIKFWARRLQTALKYDDFKQARDVVANTAKEIFEVSNYLDSKNFNLIFEMADLEEPMPSDKTLLYENERGALRAAFAKFETDEKLLRNKLIEARIKDSAWRDRYLDDQKKLEAERREIAAMEENLRNLVLEEEKTKLREDDAKSRLWASNRNYNEFIKEHFSDLPPVEIQTIQKTDAAPLVDLLDLESKISRLRRELIEIGGIDENTTREYEETSKRHNFLVSEIFDLERASSSLRGLISDLEKKINHDFKIGLTKINEEFNRHFRLMFDGGSARLSETEFKEYEIGSDLIQDRARAGAPGGLVGRAVSYGIDVHVSVPQKRVHDLNLLSGGERSLVSIALLFGIVAASPPPFLILDEIDAALDENNTVRFAEVLKDLSKTTQFILITHNRATMEAAEVLYGVTMGDDGVSKLLSLRLEEAAV